MNLKLGSTDEGRSVTCDVAKLIDTRLLVQANSGGGKSWLLRLIAEQAGATTQTIILDPEGEFVSLREKVDCVLVGRDGEIAADPRSAALLARRLMELRVSSVVDLYDLKLPARREFVRVFLDALIELPRKLWHPAFVMLDEAHVYCPKGETATSSGAVINLMAMGRKRGYCGVLATQRISKLHNDAAAECNNVFMGRTWLDNDQKRAADIMGLPSSEKGKFRELEPGEFLTFGPALSVAGVMRMRTAAVKTMHPKAGARHTMEAPRPSKAIAKVVGELSDLSNQAAQEIKDVAAAQVRIRELEKALAAAKKGQPAPAAVPPRSAAAAASLNQAAVDRVVQPALAKSKKLWQAEWSKIKRAAGERDTQLDRIRKVLEAVLTPLPTAPPEIAVMATEAPALPSRPLSPVKAAPRSPMPAAARTSAPPAEGLSPKQQEILDALLWWESIGVDRTDNEQLGAIAMLDTTGGHFSRVIKPLVDGGLVERAAGSTWLTDAGRANARPLEGINSLAEYHDMLRARVVMSRKAEGKTPAILDCVIAAGGREVSNAEIGEACAMDVTGGHYSRVISPLTTLGLIERKGGIVRPTPLLFPQELA